MQLEKKVMVGRLAKIGEPFGHHLLDKCIDYTKVTKIEAQMVIKQQEKLMKML
jgi:hypothetical protein